MHPISLENIISLIRRWKRVFLLTTLGAVMLSLAFSLPWMIPPRYRSTVVMYPTSTSSLSSSMLSDLQWSEEDLLEFGEREEANQLKQILVSEPIRDHLIVRYRLFEHYQIDTTDAHPLTRLWKEYERNVEVRINEYGAVELTVYDTDAQLAADMANKMAQLLDSVTHQMQQGRALGAEHVALTAYEDQQRYIHLLEDSLSRIMARGVHDYESQAQVIYEELAIQLGRGNVRAAQALEDKLQGLGRDGGAYIALQEELKLEKERLSILKSKWEKAGMDSRQDLPQKFIVNDAYRAERKAYPMQLAIIAGSGISSFMFTLLVLIALQRFEHIAGRIRNQEKV
ncbi:MAG TPA: hypothetical protein P5550_04010 [Bacteroidales bacterium]|nr:hypothetical protein [Bacteroidales bacterium]